MYWLNICADLVLVAGFVNRNYEDTSELRPLRNKTLIHKIKVINDYLYIVRREDLRNLIADISNAKGRGNGQVMHNLL